MDGAICGEPLRAFETRIGQSAGNPSDGGTSEAIRTTPEMVKRWSSLQLTDCGVWETRSGMLSRGLQVQVLLGVQYFLRTKAEFLDPKPIQLHRIVSKSCFTPFLGT